MGEPLKPEGTDELEWLSLRKDVDELFLEETFSQKFHRKFMENPFVPIGAVATTACLGLGLWNLRTGESVKQQFYMRGRILAQGFTLAAFISGILISAVKSD